MATLGDLSGVGSLYQMYRQVYGQNAGDEAGSSRPIMSEAEFNALPESQRFAMAGEAQQTNMFADGQGNAVGYGDPNWLGAGANAFVNDPSQIQRNGGKFSVGYGNINEDRLHDIKNESDKSGFFGGTPLQNFLRGASIVGGGALAGNYFLGSGAADAAGGMLSESIAPQVTETMVGSPWGGAGLASDIAPGYLSESVAPQVTESMAGSPFGGSMWQNALNYATSNPLQTARGVGGLLGAATSLGGNQSPQGSPSGYQGPSGPVPSFNPVGAAGQFQQSAYKPMQFDPVPFMGDSTMFQNYSPYGNSGFTGMGMPGQNPTMGFNQASPVTLPWQQQNPSFGKPYNQPSQPPMGYAGSGPIPPGMTGNYTSPVQPPNGWGSPSQGAAQGAAQGMGGLLGNVGQGDFGPQLPRPSPYGQSSIPGMDNRTAQMMARYLPGSGAGVDPLASRGSVEQAGGWQNFARQNYGPKVGGMFNQFMQANPGMNSYEDWRQRYPGM